VKVPFNIPHNTGKELEYIDDVIMRKKLSGNGKYTKLCQQWLKEKFGIRHCLLTTSCTDALEMSGVLSEIGYEDEVIIPTYTFSSAANAFVLRGAKIVYADSQEQHPNIDHTKLESLITTRTKAIVVVHYAGVACEMDTIMEIAERHNLIVIEDAAQAIGVKYKDRYLGTIGHFGAYSFHATKNIQCGEGGLLCVNDDKYISRSEIIWEKGTNRAAFLRGEVDKYTWVDVGSSYLPSELTAAFLWGQLEQFDEIQSSRVNAWDRYFEKLSSIQEISLPFIPHYSTNNAHIFYIICKSLDERDMLSDYLKTKSIQAYFHFINLHSSPNGKCEHQNQVFQNAVKYENNLLRLPIFNDMKDDSVDYVVSEISNYFHKMKS